MKPGFTIIEWLIYFFLLTVTLTGLFHFVATTHNNISILGKKIISTNSLYTVCDALCRDISTAPMHSDKWKACGPKKISWNYNNKKISWESENDTLTRTQQQFDETRKRWKRKRKSIVARNISSVKFTPHYNKTTISSIKCFISRICNNKKETVTRTAFLTNRIL